MQAKLFLMLAVVVLLAALLGGNPFLGRCRPYPAAPLNAAPPSTPAGEAVLPVGLQTNRSIPLDWNEGRIPAAAMGEPRQATPVGLVVGQPDTTGVARGTAKGKAALPQCPDLLLRPLVIDVETDPSGAPIWVLEDGRRFWRNPAGKEPELVPAPPRKNKG